MPFFWLFARNNLFKARKRWITKRNLLLYQFLTSWYDSTKDLNLDPPTAKRSLKPPYNCARQIAVDTSEKNNFSVMVMFENKSVCNSLYPSSWLINFKAVRFQSVVLGSLPVSSNRFLY